MKYIYKPEEIEKKWQDKWFSELSYEAKDLDKTREKYYLLVEFPYPSGDSMHMGHTRNYSMMDAVARLRRMKGQNVMYPIGYDSFGLPTENYAIKVKRPPQDITKENIVVFRRQLKSLGLSFDWSREVDTSDPAYYKWTQWLFLKLFEKGLAYKAEMPINWCPKCKVGCANEEVIDGKHERCGEIVEKRNINQWVLKITEYADRLDSDLDKVNYEESVKVRQRNWIGKKDWYDIRYPVEGTDEIITVCTTRPDTQFGATFVVIAPEHEIVERLKKHMPKENIPDVEKYVEETKRKSDLERIADERKKTGVFTGLYCTNSISGDKLPIYLADFVLATVGTGMVVGVPAHDLRDFQFAQKFNIPVKRVIAGPNGDKGEIAKEEDVFEDYGTVFNSGFLDGLSSGDAMVKIGEYLVENSIGEMSVRYHLRDWIFSRQHYWGEPIPIIHCPKCGMVPLSEEDLPLELPEVENYEPTDTGESPLANIPEWVNVKCPKCGGDAKRETDTMPNWAGSSWYYLRYCDPHNDKEFANYEKLKYWTPVDLYEGGAEHVTLHLLYSRFWHKVFYDLGLVPTEEPYDIRTIHGLVLGEGGVKMSKSLGNVISPDKLIKEYGADVTRAYMMFMGPYEGDTVWNEETVNGVKRFVSKYYDFLLTKWEKRIANKSEESVQKGVSELVYRVEKDILGFKFNTAIASLMKFYNKFTEENFSEEDLERLIVTVAPILPHLAEEVWSKTGHTDSVHAQSWPKVDESMFEEEKVEIPVQINGKVRGRVEINVNDTEDQIKESVLAADFVKPIVGEGEVKKFIYVPNKIVNIVV
jgi:leucyl-tRNA synthetase